ncbi:DEAD/DEAH box helicase [Propionibacterium cyclohexanicum]|uniref:DEAD/DEAH box helicase n=1 Tax=Propionibacterium cyclohexanicum TaxID=64702 RepID=UPI001FE02652|nr:DEAD/DEAH box helicase [Propionibacterium cyclohexanicum]
MAIPEWLARDPAVVHVDHRAAVAGQQAPWPRWLPSRCVESIRSGGIERPWLHQVRVAELVHDHRHVAVCTPTASGKTLGYLMPIMAATLGAIQPCATLGATQPGANRRASAPSRQRQLSARAALGLSARPTALYLAPTKALAHDQQRVARSLGPAGWQVSALDGDSDPAERRLAREQASFVLTNPDMLHHSILPHHARWSRLLGSLGVVVVDEAHRYRGVFGAQVACVLRRLRRLCALYGADPVFVISSATASEAGASGAALIGEDGAVAVVDEDTSPHPARDVVLWRPQTETGTESARLMARLVDAGCQTIAFVASRAGSEVMAVRARELLHSASAIRSYRSGYLAQDRRMIEQDLQNGSVRGVCATNALELGVDITGMDAVLICGFPGTLAAMWQQAGRAGRGDHDALVVIFQRDDPLDAYLFDHPDLIFRAPVEKTVLFPHNPHVLGPQLAAAAQESPLASQDSRWFGPSMAGLCDGLCAAGLLRRRPTGWFWPRPERAVDAIDLRGTGGKPLDIVEDGPGTVIGQVSLEDADRTVFPGAVYLHQGEHYLVDEMLPDQRQALVHRERPGYVTQPRTLTQAHLMREDAHQAFGCTRMSVGDIELSTQVIGYLRRDEWSGQVWDENPLDLPVHTMVTKGVWWTVPHQLARRLEMTAVDLGNAAHAVEHTAIGLLPAFAPCDRWDIGGVSMVVHPDTGACTVIVHDGQPGGSGFARRGFEVADRWMGATLDRLTNCSCANGCPACIVSPKCGNANQHLDKDAGRTLLAAVLGRN